MSGVCAYSNLDCEDGKANLLCLRKCAHCTTSMVFICNWCEHNNPRPASCANCTPRYARFYCLEANCTNDVDHPCRLCNACSCMRHMMQNTIYIRNDVFNVAQIRWMGHQENTSMCLREETNISIYTWFAHKFTWACMTVHRCHADHEH